MVRLPDDGGDGDGTYTTLGRRTTIGNLRGISGFCEFVNSLYL